MFKNIGSNWFVLVLGIAVTYIVLPYTIRVLGQEQYGVWLLVTSLTAYLQLLILGVPMASVRYIARTVANNDYAAVNTYVGTCAGLYLGMGAVSLLIGAGLFYALHHFFTVPPNLAKAADLAFWLVLIYVAAGFFGNLPVGILSAHNNFLLTNRVQSWIWAARLASTLVLLYWYRSLVSLAVVQLGLLVLQAIIMWLAIARKYPEIRFRYWRFEWAVVREILPFSLFALVLNLSARVAFETDALVIGHFLNVDRIPFYAVANSISMYLIEFVVAIASVVMPMAAKLEATQQYDQLKDVYLKWSKISFSLTLFAGVYFLIFGPSVLGWWIGPSFEQPAGKVLQILMVSNLVFLPARGVCLPVLMGMGKPGKPTLVFLFSAALNLVMSIWLIHPFALAGVAWGTAIPNFVFGIVVWVLACRAVQVTLREYFQYVMARSLVAALLMAGIILLCRAHMPVHGLIGLTAMGVVMAVIFSLLAIIFVYRKDRLINLQTWIPALRTR